MEHRSGCVMICWSGLGGQFRLNDTNFYFCWKTIDWFVSLHVSKINFNASLEKLGTLLSISGVNLKEILQNITFRIKIIWKVEWN